MSIQPSELLFESQKKYRLSAETIVLPNTVNTLIFIPIGQKSELREMLQKLMAACQLSETNSRVLEASYPLSAQTSVTKILLFGGTESYYPHIQLKLHQPAQLGNISYLLTCSLQELFENQQKKKDSLVALQKFFELKKPTT